MAITLDGTTGITTPAITAVSTGNLSYTGTLTGGTGVVNIGSGQVYKDASGNVGIGVTPSAWGGGKALEMPNGVSLFANSGLAASYLFTNAYYNGSAFIYKTTNLATYYNQQNGIHAWSIAPSGTAGNAITFTQAMTLNASGNLLVGTTTNPQTTKLALQYGGTNVWGVGPNSGSATFYVLNSAGTGVYLSTGTTSWAAASDERLKTTLVPFENAAVKVCTLRAGTGRYLADEDTVSRSFLIAQDVQKVLPEAISVEDNEQKTLGLRYQEVIPLLVAAIQEQQALISSLTTRLAALENK